MDAIVANYEAGRPPAVLLEAPASDGVKPSRERAQDTNPSESNLRWHGDRWNGVVDQVFEGRLARKREQLAKIVGLSDPTEIDDLIVDLQDAVRRSWAICREVTRGGSEATAERELLNLIESARPEQLVWQSSAITRVLIEGASGRFLEELETDPAALRAAVQNALKRTEPTQIGRPSGTKNFGQEQLAQRLAEIYQRTAGRRATRTIDPETGAPYGPFHDFVMIVLQIFPSRVRRYKSAGSSSASLKGIDHIVRLGAKHGRTLRRLAQQRRSREGSSAC